MSTPSLPLWSGAVPHSRGTAAADIPELLPFLPEGGSGSIPAVLVFPGGGYQMLAMDHEGYNIARWFQARGIAAFILKYRLPAAGYPHPVPLLDAQRALRLVRARAAEWKLDPARIGIMGFSAGGHLASTLATHFDTGRPKASDPLDRPSCRPDFAVLVYAVISLQDDITHQGSKLNLLGDAPDPALVESLSNERQVTAQTPPTLLLSAVDDTAVPIENSRRMHAALQKAGIPTALHEYPRGGHGFGFGHEPDNSPAGWLDRVGEWMQSQGFGV